MVKINANTKEKKDKTRNKRQTKMRAVQNKERTGSEIERKKEKKSCEPVDDSLSYLFSFNLHDLALCIN
jgi:hypothetical protein